MPPPIPTYKEWLLLSEIKQQKRVQDRLLQIIDRLVEDYHGPQYREFRVEILARVWMNANSWLKLLHKQEQRFAKTTRAVFSGHPARRDAIEQLHAQAGAALKSQFRLSHAPKKLPDDAIDQELKEVLGQPMDRSHDIVNVELRQRDELQLDMSEPKSGRVLYFNDRERRRHKLRFRNGLAYKPDDGTWSQPRTLWPKQRRSDDECTVVLYDTLWELNETDMGAAAYAMDLHGHFYTAFGSTGGWYNSQGKLMGTKFHHSTFLEGHEVACAGMIRVVKGQIIDISNDSGHYKPPPSRLVTALERLVAYGVNLEKTLVHIQGSTGMSRYRASDFLSARGDMKRLGTSARQVEGGWACRNCGKTGIDPSRDDCSLQNLGKSHSVYFLPKKTSALPAVHGSLDLSEQSFLQASSK